MNRLSNWGLAPIFASSTVPADAAVLHELLSDPDNQHRLLGTRRRARLDVEPGHSGRLITAELRVGGRSLAWLTWILTRARGTTEVDLALQPQTRGLATRLALLLGGRRWLARRLEATLATLATTAAHVVEHAVVEGPALTARTRPLEPLVGEPR